MVSHCMCCSDPQFLRTIRIVPYRGTAFRSCVDEVEPWLTRLRFTTTCSSSFHFQLTRMSVSAAKVRQHGTVSGEHGNLMENRFSNSYWSRLHITVIMKLLLLPCLGSIILNGCQASPGGTDSVDLSQPDQNPDVNYPQNGEFSFFVKDLGEVHEQRLPEKNGLRGIDIAVSLAYLGLQFMKTQP